MKVIFGLILKVFYNQLFPFRIWKIVISSTNNQYIVHFLIFDAYQIKAGCEKVLE